MSKRAVKKYHCDKLIQAIKSRSALWDNNTAEYYDRDYVKTLWQDVAAELNLNVDFVKHKWRTLRDCFRRALLQSHLRQSTPRWYGFESMLFLRDVMKIDSLTNNNTNDENSREDPLDIEQDSNHSSQDDFIFDNDPITIKEEIIVIDNPTIQKNRPDVKDQAQSEIETVSNFKNLESHLNLEYENFIKKKKLIKKKNNSDVQYETISSFDKNFDEHLYSDKEETILKKTIKRKNDCDASLEQFEEETTSSTKKNRICEDDSPDYHFLMSLLPHLKKVPSERKLLLQISLQQTILQELERNR